MEMTATQKAAMLKFTERLAKAYEENDKHSDAKSAMRHHKIIKNASTK